ncbi:MAG TPA: acyl-CoA dehydrogenase family protein [Solirubrobacteraceae bacterium]|nr:acyl-CoA dehydrogenase family protein [Solirubrobacteraceae bacterium]
MRETPATEGLEIARELSGLARRLGAETERGRRLPDELIAALRDCGLLRAGAPREVGGAELAPAIALRCAEEIARGDASAGWCVSIAITSSLLAAYLPEESREELFGGGRGVAAGVWAPRGTARAVDGGVVVSGRWAFCSGITHADLLFAGCIVDGAQDGAPPTPSVVALPTPELEILDTWHTLGLRGTGSHDAVAVDVFVPAARVFSLFDGPVVDRALYRFPIFGFFALSIAAAALGNARGAIEALGELAGGKVGMGSSRTLAERPSTQAAVAAAESSLSAARALYYEATEAAWQAAQHDEPVPLALRAGLRLAATHAVRTSAAVARSMYDLGGGSAIYDTAPLQRHFRDAHTATAHFQVNEASRELPGRLLLGQPADASML